MFSLDDVIDYPPFFLVPGLIPNATALFLNQGMDRIAPSFVNYIESMPVYVNAYKFKLTSSFLT
jgi:hypothetical protein